MLTMYPPQNNSPKTYLGTAINEAATQLTVLDSSVLPEPPNLLTLGADEDAEVVQLIQINQNIIIVERAFDGTIAKAWDADTPVYRAIAAYDVRALQENMGEKMSVEDYDANKDGVVDDSEKLGGKEPAYYQQATENLAEGEIADADEIPVYNAEEGHKKITWEKAKRDVVQSPKTTTGTAITLTDVIKDSAITSLELYGKSTQDGTPSPDSPVEIVSSEPGVVSVAGPNLFRGIGVPDDEPNYYNSLLANQAQNDGWKDGFARVYTDNTNTQTTTYPSRFVNKDVLLPLLRPGAHYKALVEFKNVKSAPEQFTLDQYYNDSSRGPFVQNTGTIAITRDQIFNGARIVLDIQAIQNLADATLSLRSSCIARPGNVTDFEVRISIYPADYDVTEYIPYDGSTYAINKTLHGIPVDDGGNYADENGQRWICDTYNVATGEYVQRIGVVDAYAGEAISTEYMSSTGQLTTGAQVIYVLPASMTWQHGAEYIPAPSPTCNILADGAQMEVEYNNIPAASKRVYFALSDTAPREIPYTWAEISEMCKAADFSEIRHGDWKDITLTGEFYDAAADATKTINALCRMEAAGIDSYYRFGDAAVPHHIDFISKDCVPGALWYNPTSTNAGGFVGSNLFTTLNGDNGLQVLLPADVSAVVVEKRAQCEIKTAENATGRAPGSFGKLWIPTEFEVWGGIIWADVWACGQAVHYPIFNDGTLDHIIKGDGHGGSRTPWWCAASVAGSASSFCNVSAYGLPTNGVAPTTNVRVPLGYRVA